MKRKTPEGYVLDAVMDYLAAKRIFALRMNTGALKIDERFLRFGSPGMADVLAIRQGREVCWIECKAANGRQSELQKAFQERVKAEGHRYILCYGIDDLIAAGL